MATLAREINTDDRGGSLSVIDVLHLKGHQGLSYNWSRIFLGVANDGNVDVYISVDATEGLHTIYSAIVSGDCEVRLYENPTVSAVGTLQAPSNRNRIIINGLSSLFYYGPTVTGVGTLLYETLIAGGAGGNAIGGGISAFDETILKGGNTYLLRLTNISGIAADISPSITFYTPKGSYVGNDWGN